MREFSDRELNRAFEVKIEGKAKARKYPVEAKRIIEPFEHGRVIPGIPDSIRFKTGKPGSAERIGALAEWYESHGQESPFDCDEVYEYPPDLVDMVTFLASEKKQQNKLIDTINQEQVQSRMEMED